MNREVRVRFAPSPTGALHIGGVRTALYNYLFARQNGGKFILRIEDTDSTRYVEGAEDYIIESLKWCGITIDEGVSVGGDAAPYRQSERREIYWKYAKELIESGWAYYAFDTAEELDAMRAEKEAAGETFIYNYEVREKLRTSLSLPTEEVEKLLKEQNNWVIRFKMPVNEAIHMHDIVRDKVVVNSSTLDDKVLYKAVDRLPTYHLANIVDDHLMNISHVIRGEEWLPSLPLHYMLYRAFGWSDTQPIFAHLPLLLKPSGKGKLSKRDGDKLGFPVFPLKWVSPDGETSRGYREDGYFADAFINMLALLGWNPGGEQEILSMDELIKLFNINKVGKSGSRFDPVKTEWFNAQYLRAKSNEELASLYMPYLEDRGIIANIKTVEKICGMIKERCNFVKDFWDMSFYFFTIPTSYDQKVLDKHLKGDVLIHIATILDILKSSEDFTCAQLESLVHSEIKENGLPMGQIMNMLRVAIVGTSMGANLFEIMEIIGKEETIKRITSMLSEVKK